MLANRSSYINVYQINLIVPPLSVGFLLPGGRCLLYSFSAHLLLPTQIDPGMFKRQNDSSKFTRSVKVLLPPKVKPAQFTCLIYENIVDHSKIKIKLISIGRKSRQGQV